MKHTSHIARPGFEPRCYRSVANRATSQAMEAPRTLLIVMSYFFVLTAPGLAVEVLSD